MAASDGSWETSGLNLGSHRPGSCYSDASDEKKRNEAPCFKDEGKEGKKPRTCTEVLGLENDGEKRSGISELLDNNDKNHVGGDDKQPIQVSIEGKQECKKAGMAERSEHYFKDSVYRIGDQVFSTMSEFLMEAQRRIYEELKEHPVNAEKRMVDCEDEEVEEIGEDDEELILDCEDKEVEIGELRGEVTLA